jgi:malonate transporter
MRPATPFARAKPLLCRIKSLVLVALRWLALGNPAGSQAVSTTAIPMMPILIMFTTQFRAAQAEAAAELFLSSVSSVITMGGFIALTSQRSSIY